MLSEKYIRLLEKKRLTPALTPGGDIGNFSNQRYRNTMEQKLLAAVRLAWGWVGIEPKQVVAVNAFGNLLLEDNAGQYWRICPEELFAKIVADNEQSYNGLMADADFLEDWEMVRLVEVAGRNLGAPDAGKCFCLKLPGVLGGQYQPENFGVISIEELILSSGDIAQQIKDIPDGGTVQNQIVD
ncbi:MAG: T6SS immunity protein Tdi1 domain-containing protein [Pseudomonadota bacterium]|nr:T6SS immunity protein Tdi1 domain-containing protein [Pseudomonadota bacterium]